MLASTARRVFIRPVYRIADQTMQREKGAAYAATFFAACQASRRVAVAA
ncbi:hypothetical protein ATCC53582_02736 [Novacetimonas hansenii]|nr:hypothetical protein ATCC53582_02736 [Novacetimonas hansenii]